MQVALTLGRFLQAALALSLLALACGLVTQADAKQRRDRTAPQVRWTSPAPGATVSPTLARAHGNRRCRVSASDGRRVTKVVFSVDGRRLNTDRVAPYDCRLGGISLAAGRHMLKAVAYDAAGNRRTSRRSVHVKRAAAGTSNPAVAPAAAAATPAPGPLAPPAGRTLIFEDDFDGTAVDPTRWSQYNGPGNAGNGLRRSSAIAVANGQLTITASWDGTNLTSGGMSHAGDQPYGRYEVRVRTEGDPTQRTSGAVLTWPRSQVWPRDGELDFYETGHSSTTRTPFFSYLHWMGGTWGGDQDRIVHEADGREWHVITMDWDPTAIRIYRDGVFAGELTDPAKIPDVAHNLCIQLDAVSNGPLAGPVRMYVDWVRIYR
jgi:hypothetical protein